MGPFREAWHGLSIENGVYSAARRIDRSKMPPKVKKVKKKVAPAPYTQAAKPTPKKSVNVLIEKRPKNFGIGSDVQPERDQTRFVRWPKYVRLQRQKRILYQRLKVPPSINQFTQTLDQQTATQLFKLLHKYRPETNAEKKVRLTQLAEKKAAGKPETEKKPVVIKYGINHITKLIESKKAKLVCIAHDVDPIEIVVWLPALCRKMGVPYCCERKGKTREAGTQEERDRDCSHVGETGRQRQVGEVVGSRSNELQRTCGRNPKKLGRWYHGWEKSSKDGSNRES